jgi:hypothetical protein
VIPTAGRRGSVLETQAIGSVPEEAQRARCMFCHAPLDNEGPAFVDHIRTSPDCEAAYEAWLQHLDEDRSGGG